MHLLSSQKNKIKVVKYINPETNETEMALLAFNGKNRDKIIAEFNKQFRAKGSHIKNGGVSSPKTMLSLIAGGFGSVGLAGVNSGQLFMATANPATLMQIGSGVGSAVMGSSGIVAQAPFLPVSGVMPVAAPLIAFQAFSTITIMKQFEVVNKKLDKIQDTLNTILQREEATIIGKVISASNRIAEIQRQFLICNQFTDDMIIRLALLEDNINPIVERYCLLYKNQPIDSANVEKINQKQTDAFMAIITSILDIQIDSLKMKLNIQNKPEYMEAAAKAFAEKTNSYHKLWGDIQKDPKEIEAIANELKEAISEMNWFQRILSMFLGKKGERIELEEKSKTFKEAAKNYQELITNTVNFAYEFEDKKGLTPDSKMSLFYWRDELGEHVYYTDDLIIEVSQKNS